MKRLLLIFIGFGATCLASCSSKAPRAPLGLDRRPANTSETVTGLLATGDHTPTKNLSSAALVETGPPQHNRRRDKYDMGPGKDRHVAIHSNQVDHDQRT